jgi:hypothetical protein
MVKLSVKVRFTDEHDSAWYEFRVTLKNIITGRAMYQVKVYMVDYEGQNQYGGPIDTYVYNGGTFLQSLLKGVDRFQADLTQKALRNAREDSERPRRVPDL